jgi:hypothetical protein
VCALLRRRVRVQRVLQEHVLVVLIAIVQEVRH